MLLERLPDGRVIAVDGSPSMIERGARALARPGRTVVVHSDLVELELDEPVDAVFSNAIFHWIPDHERLFARLHAALAPGGRLEAQCGGAGQRRRVHGGDRRGRRRARLRRAGGFRPDSLRRARGDRPRSSTSVGFEQVSLRPRAASDPATRAPRVRPHRSASAPTSRSLPERTPRRARRRGHRAARARAGARLRPPQHLSAKEGGPGLVLRPGPPSIGSSRPLRRAVVQPPADSSDLTAWSAACWQMPRAVSAASPPAASACSAHWSKASRACSQAV